MPKEILHGQFAADFPIAKKTKFTKQALPMRKPRQTKGSRTDTDISHGIRNTIFSITTLPPHR